MPKQGIPGFKYYVGIDSLAQVATREDRLRHDAPQFGPAEPMRSLSSRFTGSVQFLGSFVGIPLALLGGYATYSSNFSVEAKCQSLRTSIVSMLDKKADPSTLRLLMQRDVAAFQRDCGEVDPGCRLPRHTDSAEEVIVVVAGSAEVRLDGEPSTLGPGEMALVPELAPHEVRNAGDEVLRFAAVYAAADVVTTYEAPVQPAGERERKATA